MHYFQLENANHNGGPTCPKTADNVYVELESEDTSREESIPSDVQHRGSDDTTERSIEGEVPSEQDDHLYSILESEQPLCTATSF